MSEHMFDRLKWQQLSIFEQMGNIASEVGRALAAKRRGDIANMNGAFYRGLDLLDATTEALVRTRSPRMREVLRAREQFARSILTNEEDPALEQYFFRFALAARLQR